MANIAYKYRIYPNKEQKEKFVKTFGCVRFIYNKMLFDKIDHYKKTKENLKITPAKYKKDFAFLKEVDSLALANAGINLERAYKNFFRDKKVAYPKFKSKHKNQNSYTTNNQKGTIDVKGGYLKLPKVGYVKIKLHREIPNNYNIKSATITMSASGKYYVSILLEYENQVEKQELSKAIGLDYSMHELYVDSEGNKAKYPRYYRKVEERLKRESRKLSKMQKGSNNRSKQRRKIAILHEKVANQRKDFLHKLSRKITNAYDLVCIESLNMKVMSQCLKFGKSVLDNGWGMFVRFMEYKLNQLGKTLAKVDKYYASSQICSSCGSKNPEVKDLSLRKWKCVCCGMIHNRDKNAAINIRNEGIRLANA